MTTISSHHKTVSLDEIEIDPIVQRKEGIDQRRVDRMAASFDPRALGTVVLSVRSNGRMVVLDGMHRCAAARLAGYRPFVNVEVFEGLTIPQEAQMFLLLNATKSPSAISKFLAGVVTEGAEVVEMNDIIQSHGWTVSNQVGPGFLSAVDAVGRIYASGNKTVSTGRHPEILDRTIEIVTAAWEHDQGAVQQHVLLAVAQLIGRFGPSLDTAKLVTEMQATRPGVLVGRAKVLRDAQGGTVPAALAKILAGMHNKKRRTNLLPEWVWIR